MGFNEWSLYCGMEKLIWHTKHNLIPVNDSSSTVDEITPQKLQELRGARARRSKGIHGFRFHFNIRQRTDKQEDDECPSWPAKTSTDQN
nr:hypothetical protein Iba_chr04bCG11510 [Ipomoea batatas]GMD71656.1 hypothetical protein Iba_scaffold1523697CG0010 [Ipomoea batatas]